MTACEEEIQKLEGQIQDTGENLDAIINADSDAQKDKLIIKQQAQDGKNTGLLRMKFYS